MRDITEAACRSAGLRRLTARLGLHLAGALVAAGCVAVEPGDEVSQVEQAATVESHVASACSTSVVIELSKQIAAEVDCMMPGQLVPLVEGDGIVFAGSAVLPYMDEEARDDLLAAAAQGGTIQLNSAYRTVVQQYLLYRWLQAGRCGITAAAEPGQSNHESGRAIDVGNWPDRIGALEAHGWAQTVPGDEVHFDHLASPDIRGSDVHAFQRLWNRNHPEDQIDEDGEYGPMTASRLASSPAEGFPVGAECDDGGGGGGGEEPGTGGSGGGGVDGGEPGGEDADGLISGCAAGGGGGGGGALALLLIALLAQRGRRAKNVIVGPSAMS